MLNKQTVIVVSLSILFGCASQEKAEDTVVEERSNRSSDCISKSSIRDYKVLDDQNLIVTEGASRRYHVVLARKAFGLRSATAIGFESSTGRVCGGFDRLIVRESLGPEGIRIDQIRRLSPEQEQDLLVQFGLREPEYEQPRQPQEVEGAEVEELD